MLSHDFPSFIIIEARFPSFHIASIHLLSSIFRFSLSLTSFLSLPPIFNNLYFLILFTNFKKCRLNKKIIFNTSN